MKPFTFAIASIVDANTGNGLVHRANQPDYIAIERRAHQIRSRSIIASIKAGLASAIANFRSGAKQRRDLKTLMNLSDRLLDDIGLNRGDLYAVQLGAETLEELDARRQSARQLTPNLQGVAATQSVTQEFDAVNEQFYDKPKCA